MLAAAVFAAGMVMGMFVNMLVFVVMFVFVIEMHKSHPFCVSLAVLYSPRAAL